MNTIPSARPHDLQSAIHMLRAGRWDAARDLLGRLTREHPRIAEVHWLVATLHFETGELEAAQHALSRTLELDPGRASPHALLGEIRLRQGNLQDAENCFRQTLALQPDHLPAATSLGRLFLKYGTPEQALALADDFLRRTHSIPAMLMLKGEALLSLRRPDEAVTAFERLLQIAPGMPESELALASALIEAGQHKAAETTVRKTLAKGRLLPESHFILARALMGDGRAADAVSELRKAVKARPDYIAAHTNLCELLWMQTGDVESATAELDRALRSNPGSTALRQVKAKLLEGADQPVRAIGELESALAHSPEDFGLWETIAQIALKCDPPRALHYAQLALQRAPADSGVRIAWCSALLGVGRAQEAAEVAAELHRRHPHDSHSLALLACAWRLLGDSRYNGLYDYRLVIPQFIETPNGWPTLEHYLADLSASLYKLHTLRTHPVGQSLRSGTQADLEFERSQDPAIRAFAQAIDKPIRHYMETIGSGNDVLRLRNTRNYRISGAWSVRLRPLGHHLNHIHPEGWLSSACYIELPPAIAGPDRSGWIQFGQPGVITTPALGAEHFVKPEPGQLVLFPSYMWHGTVPFEGPPEASRLTIAFDLVPAEDTSG